MKGETQALHLAQMMQNHVDSMEYELALPLVMVRSSRLKTLSIQDVFLLNEEVLRCVLIEDTTICAELVLKNINDVYALEIIEIIKKPIQSNHSNKYETIIFSFGKCKIKSLDRGESLDTTQFNVDKLSLIVGKNILAEGSLVSIDNEIAVKINKVMR